MLLPVVPDELAYVFALRQDLQLFLELPQEKEAQHRQYAPVTMQAQPDAAAYVASDPVVSLSCRESSIGIAGK